ncbi:type VI secretion system baseplate subunit TssF [Escherichia coli]
MFRKKIWGVLFSTQAARQWPTFESFSHQMEYSRKREVVYWHHRTKTSLFHRGFDHTLAFIHADGGYPSDESLLSNEVVSVSLTCTNRELPSQIRSGDITGTTGKKCGCCFLFATLPARRNHSGRSLMAACTGPCSPP